MNKSKPDSTMPTLHAARFRHEGGRRMRSCARLVSPFVSIITVVFNAAHELGPLMNSVFAHQNDQVEFLIIDGGSNDGTLELLRASDARIDYWMSEPDGGIYDAMNKGIAAAHGEYLLHLNAGDKLLTVPLEILRACSQKKVDVAAFSVLVDSKQIFRPKTGFLLTIENTWHHQGTFYRRAIHPGYDPNYRVFGDMCLNQRMFKEGKSVQLFETVIAEHRDDGISNSRDSVGEVYKAIRSNFGWQRVLLAFLWFKYKGLIHRFGMLLQREQLDHV
jgi:glycosyltransferase involved in cell wall biosynthesis